MAFVAFLDACVLFPPSLRNVILTIVETSICPIRWSSAGRGIRDIATVVPLKFHL